MKSLSRMLFSSVANCPDVKLEPSALRASTSAVSPTIHLAAEKYRNCGMRQQPGHHRLTMNDGRMTRTCGHQPKMMVRTANIAEGGPITG
jgi:hypothetical protein